MRSIFSVQQEICFPDFWDNKWKIYWLYKHQFLLNHWIRKRNCQYVSLCIIFLTMPFIRFIHNLNEVLPSTFIERHLMKIIVMLSVHLLRVNGFLMVGYFASSFHQIQLRIILISTDQQCVLIIWLKILIKKWTQKKREWLYLSYSRQKHFSKMNGFISS